MKTILSVFGTRPEVIKLAPVIQALERRQGRFRTINVSSSQHRDLVPRFAATLGLRIDRDLDVMTEGQEPSEVLARVLRAGDEVLRELQPDLVLVQGDTTTALGAALAAFHRGIDLGHVEAGLRTDDPASPFPEEMNRRLVSRVARFHFAPTVLAAERLREEGIPPERIVVTGNPVVDSLNAILATGSPSVPLEALLARLSGHRILTLTTHRRENFGPIMEGHLEALRGFVARHQDVALVFPVHPNPAVRESAGRILGDTERIHCIDPLDYGDFIQLLARSWLIVSDSGGVQEEAPSLRRPVLVLRDTTERPEAVQCGVAKLVGHSAQRLGAQLEEAYGDEHWFEAVRSAESPFGNGDSGERIADAIEGFLKCSP